MKEPAPSGLKKKAHASSARNWKKEWRLSHSTSQFWRTPTVVPFQTKLAITAGSSSPNMEITTHHNRDSSVSTLGSLTSDHCDFRYYPTAPLLHGENGGSFEDDQAPFPPRKGSAEMTILATSSPEIAKLKLLPTSFLSSGVYDQGPWTTEPGAPESNPPPSPQVVTPPELHHLSLPSLVGFHQRQTSSESGVSSESSMSLHSLSRSSQRLAAVLSAMAEEEQESRPGRQPSKIEALVQERDNLVLSFGSISIQPDKENNVEPPREDKRKKPQRRHRRVSYDQLPTPSEIALVSDGRRPRHRRSTGRIFSGCKVSAFSR